MQGVTCDRSGWAAISCGDCFDNKSCNMSCRFFLLLTLSSCSTKSVATQRSGQGTSALRPAGAGQAEVRLVPPVLAHHDRAETEPRAVRGLARALRRAVPADGQMAERSGWLLRAEPVRELGRAEAAQSAPGHVHSALTNRTGAEQSITWSWAVAGEDAVVVDRRT